MPQMPLFAFQTWTVTEITRRLRRLLEGDPALQDAWVQGEISNLSRPASGHIYLTIKDSGAALKAVIWRSDAARLRGLSLRDGLQVEAHGKIGMYEPGGQYQLYVDDLRMAGEGALYAQFLRLKESLETEGLFERKREIPAFPRRIGLVTSASGAALRDVLNTLKRRMPLAQVFLAPSAVQGEAAPAELLKALQALNALTPPPQVILLARGGGSLEDLWAFNDERLVRAVAASPVPVICGVGHETDFTLCDFAADLRAPTPTAAAELASSITCEALQKTLNEALQNLEQATQEQISRRRLALSAARQRLRYNAPSRRLETESQRVDELSRDLRRALGQTLRIKKALLTADGQRLEALSPLAILRRGYALLTDSQGHVIVNPNQVAAGTILQAQIAHGSLTLQVESTIGDSSHAPLP